MRLPNGHLARNPHGAVKYNDHQEDAPTSFLKKIFKDIPVLKGTKNTAITSSVGYQGYS